MNLPKQFTSLRKAHGLTQMQLAQEAGVSLPTVQNIESGKTDNPSLDILTKIASALGLEITIKERLADWDVLALCGAPISSKKNMAMPVTKELLIETIRACAVDVQSPVEEDGARKKAALIAILLALRDYFPSVFKKNLSRSKLIMDLIPLELDGTLIKLRRIAIANLAKYL